MITSDKRKNIKPSPDWLYNSAINYLSRYSTSSKNLERFLQRKSLKLLNDKDEIIQVKLWIKNTIEKLETANFLNDKEFAISKALFLFNKGNPSKIIFTKLKYLGICDQYIKDSIQNITDSFNDDKTVDNLDFQAAQIFIKKKNILFNNSTTQTSSQINKNIKTLGRAGFSYDTIRKFFKFIDTDFDN